MYDFFENINIYRFKKIYRKIPAVLYNLEFFMEINMS